MKRGIESKRGAALVESCLVLIVLCLILFGLLQASYMVGARDILSFATMASARSAQVGHDDFMVEKTALYFGIPVAGPILNPSFRSTRRTPDTRTPEQRWSSAVNLNSGIYSAQYYAEKKRKTDFYLSESESEMRSVLDYDNWQSSVTTPDVVRATGSGMVSVEVGQYVPMVMPFARAFSRLLSSTYDVPVYRSDTRGLADQGWADSATAGEIMVPALHLGNAIQVEDHAGYYLGDNLE